MAEKMAVVVVIYYERRTKVQKKYKNYTHLTASFPGQKPT